MLPNLQAFAELTNHGLAGPANPLYNNCCGDPNAFFIGGNGNVLSQIFRRNFPGLLGGCFAEYSVSQSRRAGRLRDGPIADAADRTAVAAHHEPGAGGREDSVIGLQQARARYQTAVDTRELAEQSLMAEQSRFKYGVATVAQVIQAQKDLATGQDSEVQAMANYTHAQHRVRSGDGADARRQPHLDGRSHGGTGAAGIDDPGQRCPRRGRRGWGNDRQGSRQHSGRGELWWRSAQELTLPFTIQKPSGSGDPAPLPEPDGAGGAA